MRFPRYVIALLLSLSLCACASQPPRYRSAAIDTVMRAQRAGADVLYPAELQSILDAFKKGDTLLQQREGEDAERYFYLSLLKGQLLEREIAEEQARRKEAARRAEAAKQADLARRAREELERLAKARAQAEAEAEAKSLAQKEAADAERRKARAPKEQHVLVSSYTVRRGESLPLIASQPEVYGDRNLWPLIYRANRDQISDPRHIWPGQVLRIPRSVGRDEIGEAKRYAQERPLR